MEQLRLKLGVLPTLKETQALWYAILRATGFRDLECGTDPDGMLRTTFTPPASAAEYREHAEYFRLAERYLRSVTRAKTWPTEQERLVWQLHSEGLSIREIVAQASAEMPRYYIGLAKAHEIVSRHRRVVLKGVR